MAIDGKWKLLPYQQLNIKTYEMSNSFGNYNLKHCSNGNKEELNMFEKEEGQMAETIEEVLTQKLRKEFKEKLGTQLSLEYPNTSASVEIGMRSIPNITYAVGVTRIDSVLFAGRTMITDFIGKLNRSNLVSFRKEITVQLGGNPDQYIVIFRAAII